jgi:hypothetical protein
MSLLVTLAWMSRIDETLGDASTSRLLFRVLVDKRKKKLRAHPWARLEYDAGSGTWWGIGPAEDKTGGGVFLRPASDSGYLWWNRDLSWRFQDHDDVIAWLVDRVVECREVPTDVERPKSKRRKKRRMRVAK